jgi:hypothetical protein
MGPQARGRTVLLASPVRAFGGCPTCTRPRLVPSSPGCGRSRTRQRILRPSRAAHVESVRALFLRTVQSRHAFARGSDVVTPRSLASSTVLRARREEGRIVNVPCHGDGPREVLASTCVTAEDGTGWLAFLRAVRGARGRRIELAISAAHPPPRGRDPPVLRGSGPGSGTEAHRGTATAALRERRVLSQTG